MRLIFSFLAVLLATSANAEPSLIAPLSAPSVADQIRHPRGQQGAGNCQTTCQWIGGRQFCNTHCF
jgi:hypothetical protein